MNKVSDELVECCYETSCIPAMISVNKTSVTLPTTVMKSNTFHGSRK